MTVPNLVLKYMVSGDNRLHVKGASRIKVDKQGVLTVYGTEGGDSESVSLARLCSLTIHSVPDFAPSTLTVQ